MNITQRMTVVVAGAIAATGVTLAAAPAAQAETFLAGNFQTKEWCYEYGLATFPGAALDCRSIEQYWRLYVTR